MCNCIQLLNGTEVQIKSNAITSVIWSCNRELAALSINSLHCVAGMSMYIDDASLISMSPLIVCNTETDSVKIHKRNTIQMSKITYILYPLLPPDNTFALPTEVFSSCLAIVSAVTVGGLFLWPALRYGTGYQTI